MNKNDKRRRCGQCDRTDGLSYLSSPPMVKCNRDDLYHHLDDICWYKEDEVNKPDKPRLCEILGVEAGERFRVKGYDGVLSMNTDGTFNVLEGEQTGASRYLLMALEDPSRVIHQKRLTEKEFAICKAVGAKYVSKDSSNEYTDDTIDLWAGKPHLDEFKVFYSSDFDEDWLGKLREDLFPSVEHGDCLEVRKQ